MRKYGSSFWHFNSRFALKYLFEITEKKHKLKINNYLYDGIIDVTLFDGVEGLNF